MGLNEKAREFVDTVKKTREFIEFKQARADIDKKRDLRNEVDEFMKKQMELITSNKPSKQSEAKIAELNKKFQNLSKIAEVDRLLKSGRRFNDMMLKVYKIINDSITSELKSR